MQKPIDGLNPFNILFVPLFVGKKAEFMINMHEVMSQGFCPSYMIRNQENPIFIQVEKNIPPADGYKLESLMAIIQYKYPIIA